MAKAKSVAQINAEVARKGSRRVAFRATAGELDLLLSLKAQYQFDDISKVLHKIIATFKGAEAKRQVEIDKVKRLISLWEIKEFELK